MEEKRICRDWLPPMEWINDSASCEKGSRPLIARSAPRRLLEFGLTLDCTLARKEKAITIDATLRITQAMDRNSGLRPRRASRRAMRKTHNLNSGLVSIRLPLFSALPSTSSGRTVEACSGLVRKHRPSWRKISSAALEMTMLTICHLEPFAKAQGRLRERS